MIPYDSDRLPVFLPSCSLSPPCSIIKASLPCFPHFFHKVTYNLPPLCCYFSLSSVPSTFPVSEVTLGFMRTSEDFK